MELYDVALAIHVLGAVIWVGGNIMFNVLAYRVQRGGTRQELVTMAAQLEWIGTRIFTPVGVIILLMGIYMVSERWEFDFTFVTLGIVGFVISFGIGSGYLAPTMKAAKALADEKGIDSPEVTAKFDRLFMVARLDGLLLAAVVVIMAVKPGV